MEHKPKAAIQHNFLVNILQVFTGSLKVETISAANKIISIVFLEISIERLKANLLQKYKYIRKIQVHS